MTANEIRTAEYKYEWMDHLHHLYGNYISRNSREHWALFLSRPEFANAEKNSEIAAEILKYMVNYGNISGEIVRLIEETFHYSEQSEKYEEIIGIENMEAYNRYFPDNADFPPFAMFGELDEDKDYDTFINAFCELYFNSEHIEAENYEKAMNEIISMGIDHPYLDLLRSEYYMMCGEFKAALECLDDMEDCYYKHLNMGMVFSNMEMYDMAVKCYEAAVALKDKNIDPGLIADYVMCKWCCGAQIEALTVADKFAENGYEYVIMPLKIQMLDEISKLLDEKSKTEDLTEAELLIVKEYFMTIGDYESVIRLGEASWKNGFENESWTVDMAEAYYESGRYEQAQNIVDMVYHGQKEVGSSSRLKIREIKARLLFTQGKVAEAYEIMETLFKVANPTMSQQFTLAQMYFTGGRYRDAQAVLRVLRMNSPDNIAYTYALAQCCFELAEDMEAHYWFSSVFDAEPEFELAAYYMVQSCIDCMAGEDVEVYNELIDECLEEFEQARKYMAEPYIRYLEAQLLEVEGKAGKAEKMYKQISDSYEDEPFELKLLYDVYLRYFVMREDRNAKIGTMIAEISSVLEEFPGAEALWEYLARLYKLIEDDDAAETCYENVLKVNPFNIGAMNNLINGYFDKYSWYDAWEMQNRMIDCTDDSDFYLTKVVIGLKLGKMEECVNTLALYEKRCGRTTDYYKMCAEIAMNSGEYEKALECYETYMEKREVSEEPCYDDIAICMCKLGRWDDAEELMRTVCMNSKNFQDFNWLHEIYMYQGKFDDAEEVLDRIKKVFKIGFFDEGHDIKRAEMLFEAEDKNRLKEAAAGLISPDGHRLQGIIELTNSNLKKAAKLLKKALKEQDDKVDNYSWLAFALYLKGETSDAEEIAMQGLELFKEKHGDAAGLKESELICMYAFLNMMSGKTDTALEYFEKALNQPTCCEYICSECYEAHYGLGIYYACTGNEQKAKEEFKKALQIRPANMVCRKISLMV